MEQSVDVGGALLQLVWSRHVIDLPVGFALMGRPFGSLWEITQRWRLRRACKVVAPSKRPILGPAEGLVDVEVDAEQQQRPKDDRQQR
jgi:hypothetical protein